MQTNAQVSKKKRVTQLANPQIPIPNPKQLRARNANMPRLFNNQHKRKTQNKRTQVSHKKAKKSHPEPSPRYISDEIMPGYDKKKTKT